MEDKRWVFDALHFAWEMKSVERKQVTIRAVSVSDPSVSIKGTMREPIEIGGSFLLPVDIHNTLTSVDLDLEDWIITVIE